MTKEEKKENEEVIKKINNVKNDYISFVEEAS